MAHEAANPLGIIRNYLTIVDLKLPESSGLPNRWLTAGVSAEVPGARAVVLGPEPLIGPQRIVLRLDDQRLVLATDGIGPFVVVNEPIKATP